MNEELASLWIIVVVLAVWNACSHMRINRLRKSIITYDMQWTEDSHKVRELQRKEEINKKNLVTIIKRLNRTMATMKDLVDRLGELKPLVDANAKTVTQLQNGMIMASAQINDLNAKILVAVADQEQIDMATALADELKSSLSPSVPQE